MTKFATLKHIAKNLIQVKKRWISITILMLLYVALLSSSPYFYKLLIDTLEENLTLGKVSIELIIMIF